VLVWHLVTLNNTHTFCRAPLDKGSANVETTCENNFHKRKNFMSPAGFSPEIPVSEPPQAHFLDLVASGI